MATVLTGNGLIVELIHHQDALLLATAAPNLTRTFQVRGIFKTGVTVSDLDAALKEIEADCPSFLRQIVDAIRRSWKHSKKSGASARPATRGPFAAPQRRMITGRTPPHLRSFRPGVRRREFS